MIFMPIPSKYTIYHKLMNNDEYNNFLPLLYEGLEKRGIPVVKLYEDYNKAELENIIEELLTVHISKLVHIEKVYLNVLKEHLANNSEPLEQADRDTLIVMYDRMGEGGY